MFENVQYFSLEVFLFEHTQLLQKKIPEATQICQSLSQEFSLKTKSVWPRCAKPPSRKHFLNTVSSRISMRHKNFHCSLYELLFIHLCCTLYKSNSALVPKEITCTVHFHNELPVVMWVQLAEIQPQVINT